MSKQERIEKTINTLQKLSADKVAELSDFTEFILQRSEDKEITAGIGHLSVHTKSYQFLHEEEDLYTLNDVKAPYNGKG
jgi:stress response protein YsnF